MAWRRGRGKAWVADQAKKGRAPITGAAKTLEKIIAMSKSTDGPAGARWPAARACRMLWLRQGSLSRIVDRCGPMSCQ